MQIKITIILFIIFTILFSCSEEKPAVDKSELNISAESHFGTITMLTDGGENAEAYLSFDEQKIIYQATTGKLECDQIFVMNMDGSDKHMVSTGFGRTTCSYFLPGDTKILYSSTHGADKACPAKPDFSRGYVWKLYNTFNIYFADADGNNTVQITDSPAYDAEATVSPLGDKIVFTSTRDGDPEIYIMDINGSNQKRLTFNKGYDGGPFFSPDGKQIVFRASRPKTEKELADYKDLVQNGLVRPTNLEIFVMNADGTDMKQVTDLGVASFAPYFNPDGKRIIFSSNHGSENGREFELYMVNSDGTNLEQITHSDGFDGFPIFTKDGKHLVFASNRNNKEKGDTNIFIAEWLD